MSRDTLQYTNDEVTVVWKPELCIHSTLCWKGLIEVFNPKLRPWINMTGASSERIVEQVRNCPSGALSYHLNKDTAPGAGDKVIAESAHILKVQVTPDGPYIINTGCLVIHGDGREEIKTGTVALCRCGASGNKPYCDGSHKTRSLPES